MGKLLAALDPDGGASVAAIDRLKDFLTGTLAISFFALVVGAVGISFGYRWMIKATRGAGPSGPDDVYR